MRKPRNLYEWEALLSALAWPLAVILISIWIAI